MKTRSSRTDAASPGLVEQEQQQDKKSEQQPLDPQQLPASIEQVQANDESSMRTPEKVHKIPRDDSFKTCKAHMPSPSVRRQLRATPARNSILSGGKPYKEVHSSSKKFNSRRKQGRLQKGGLDNTQLNDTANSNETFIRHEQDLMYERDSLESDLAQQKQRHIPKEEPILERDQPLDIVENITEDVTAPRMSSLKKAPIKKASPKKTSPKKASPKKASPMKSPTKRQTTRVISRPLPKASIFPKATPRAMVAPKPKNQSQPFVWNRYMPSSTAKKPTTTANNQFKKPFSIGVNSSVASSRRCLGPWNTPQIVRTQSFKSTAELERDYFSSLRSSRS